MSAAADALLAEFDALAVALRGHATTISAELRRGGQGRVTEIDRFRVDILNLLRRVNECVLQAGFVPVAERTRPLDFRANEMRVEAVLWTSISLLVAMQLPPQKRPFEGARGNEPTPNGVLIDANDVLLNRLHSMLKAGTQTEQAFEHGCHDDIPLAPSAFTAAIHAAYRILMAQGRHKEARFLDVGCGNGFKVISAAAFFEHCDGLEYENSSVVAAQNLLDWGGMDTCRVWQEDATTFEGYGDYDVIYLYRPLRDTDALARLNSRILEQVSPGTLIISPADNIETDAEPMSCARVTGHVFVAGMDKEGAEKLCEEASFTGLSLPGRQHKQSKIWGEILDVSESRGFVIAPRGVGFAL